MAMIPYLTQAAANSRSAGMWLNSALPGWQPGDITQRLYPIRTRTGDPEDDEGLPDGVDVVLVVRETSDKLNGLILAEDLTADELAALVVLYEAWAIGTPYVVGDLRAYNDLLYRCVQAHTSQSDWTPDVTDALWADTAPVGVIPEWVQPQGGHDAYNTGDRVTYGGQVWESTIDANVWAPGVFGWEVV